MAIPKSMSSYQSVLDQMKNEEHPLSNGTRQIRSSIGLSREVITFESRAGNGRVA